MALRLARLTAIAAALLGVIAIPALTTMPSLLLCRLWPPFEECIVGQFSGAQYIQGDSPAALTWVLTSFVIAPLASLLGVWLVGRGHLRPGRIFGALGIAPNSLLLAGTYAVMPFHPVVFALTLAALVALLVSKAPAGRDPQRVFEFAIAVVVVLVLALGIWLAFALRPQGPPVASPPPAAATTATLTASPGVAPQRTIQLYYYSPAKDRDESGNSPCSEKGLVAVERQIPLTQTPVQDAVRLLLKGEITPEERARGITTEFPLRGLELRGASLDNGVLTLSFADPSYATTGGACRTGILWLQIKKTAGQFEGVKDVRFQPQDVFQP